MDSHVLIAGRPVHALSAVGDLTIAHEFSTTSLSGPASLTFAIDLGKKDRPGWLVKGAHCVATLGRWPNWAGKVSEVDWADGTVTAEGVIRPDTAIDAAIARGAVTWTRAASISTTAITSGSESAAEFDSLNALLGAYVEQTATADARIFVDSRRRLFLGNDPASPSYVLQPGAGELAWASESQATRVIGRWQDSAGTLATNMVGTGSDELLVDLTPRGGMTSAQATNVLTSILTALSSGGWSGGITVSADQVVGGHHPAVIAERVGRGAMFRLLGQRDPRPGRVPVGFVDFIAERAEYNATDGKVTLTPRGMVARDLSSILADFNAAAA
jgi:hypothetical protein